MAKLYGVLGFRDFEAFNLALLAKQGWQMIHNDHSLCAHVFKGKYFHNSFFIEAKLGYNPLFVWRSLLEGSRPDFGSGRFQFRVEIFGSIVQVNQNRT